jgi:hypothetical protein
MDKCPAPRYEVVFPVRLMARSTTGFLQGLTRNISESGMMIHASIPLEAGTPVRLEPLLVVGSAEVVWVRKARKENDGADGPAEIGLRFVGLSQYDRENISALVRSLALTASRR